MARGTGPVLGSPLGALAAMAILAMCLVLLTGCGVPQLGSVSRAAAREPIQLSANEREHLRFRDARVSRKRRRDHPSLS